MLRIHFLNVGHGDCTIIKHHSGRLTMIDINNSQEYDDESLNDIINEEIQRLTPLNRLAGLGSTLQYYVEARVKAEQELTDPIAFLKTTYPGENIFRFVLTHPDLDHMRGLKRLHNNVGFVNFWDTSHTKPTPSYRSDADREDWEFYQQLRKGDKARKYTRGNSHYAFGVDEYGRIGGDNIEILSPTPELVRSCNTAGKSNDLSLVLRVFHAGKSVILPGDAENDAWNNMISYYGESLKSDFLKASHHGRDSGYSLDAVKLIKPLLTFVSVGRKPDTDASSKYRSQCQRVASTRYHGNIELRLDDNGLHEWFVDKNPG